MTSYKPKNVYVVVGLGLLTLFFRHQVPNVQNLTSLLRCVLVTKIRKCQFKNAFHSILMNALHSTLMQEALLLLRYPIVLFAYLFIYLNAMVACS